MTSKRGKKGGEIKNHMCTTGPSERKKKVASPRGPLTVKKSKGKIINIGKGRKKV